LNHKVGKDPLTSAKPSFSSIISSFRILNYFENYLLLIIRRIWKLGSVTFHHLEFFNFMQKIRKNWYAVTEETCYVGTDKRKYRTQLIGSLWKSQGIPKKRKTNELWPLFQKTEVECYFSGQPFHLFKVFAFSRFHLITFSPCFQKQSGSFTFLQLSFNFMQKIRKK